jgi:hypothetical protein
VSGFKFGPWTSKSAIKDLLLQVKPRRRICSQKRLSIIVFIELNASCIEHLIHNLTSLESPKPNALDIPLLFQLSIREILRSKCAGAKV